MVHTYFVNWVIRAYPSPRTPPLPIITRTVTRHVRICAHMDETCAPSSSSSSCVLYAYSCCVHTRVHTLCQLTRFAENAKHFNRKSFGRLSARRTATLRETKLPPPSPHNPHPLCTTVQLNIYVFFCVRMFVLVVWCVYVAYTREMCLYIYSIYSICCSFFCTGLSGVCGVVCIVAQNMQRTLLRSTHTHAPRQKLR